MYNRGTTAANKASWPTVDYCQSGPRRGKRTIMLDGLDAIDWARLRHAYGSAEDVPDLLRDLASDDDDRQYEALDTLNTNIWHQGTVYEASAYAAPFLIELVQAPSVSQRPMLLYLISLLAQGSSYVDVHAEVAWSEQDRTTPEFHEQRVSELGWVRATHEAVAAGIPAFLSLLHDPDAEVAVTAAYALSCYPERADQLAPALRGQFDLDLPASTKASIVLALGMLAGNDPEYASIYENILA